MNSRRSRALRAIWQGLVRAGRYLGSILRDTLVYVWRMCADLVGAGQFLWRRWQVRRPETASEFAAWRGPFGERRAARWAPWRTLTAGRRLQVRAATLALALVLLAAARVWLRPPSQADVSSSPSSSTAGAAPTRSTPKMPAATATPPDDVRQAVARFAADRQRIGRGEWAVIRDVPILERGPLGAWDDYLVAIPVVLKEDGAGTRYRMWFRGCHLALREHACGVGHATSPDGVVWSKASEPVFAPPDPALQDSLHRIAVVKAGGRYYLWYSVMADPFNGRRRATVYLATSADGLAWIDEGQVLEGASETPPAIAHSVLHDGQRFHLWYVTSVEGESSMHHLSSPDGKAWTAIGGTSLREALGTTLTPNLGRLLVKPAQGGGFRAYTYDSVLGALRSPDGTTWTKEDIEVGPLKDWRKQRVEVHSLSGVLDDEGLWLWMDIRSRPEDMRVGVAFRKGN